ncbi:MAG: tatB [Deltaproteobacteria bacterium]|nr:tatB [Deltaproteobacteria bacterium]
MFGIGFQEMIIILVVVLIVFGPKRLPDLAKSMGKGLAEFKKASDEVRKGIEEAVREEEQPSDPARETGGEITAAEPPAEIPATGDTGESGEPPAAGRAGEPPATGQG